MAASALASAGAMGISASAASTRDIDAGTAVAPGHPQQPSIVHMVQQLRAGVRRAAEPIGDPAMREMRVHFARMHHAAFTHECEDLLRLPQCVLARIGLVTLRGCINAW